MVILPGLTPMDLVVCHGVGFLGGVSSQYYDVSMFYNQVPEVASGTL